MSRVFAVLAVVMLTGVVVTTQRQLPPGYLDPAPILTRLARPSEPTTCAASPSRAPPMPARSARRESPRATRTGRASTRWPTTRGR